MVVSEMLGDFCGLLLLSLMSDGQEFLGQVGICLKCHGCIVTERGGQC